MKIAISGGTGFIGSHLIQFFKANHHEVILISRSSTSKFADIPCLSWSQLEQETEPLEGLDALINIAGESINQRWTAAAKQRILNSRVTTAQKVAKLVNRLTHKPKVVINGSGMSIYGTSETDIYDEQSPHQIVDFLSGVVEQWEQAIDLIQATRVVKLRIGLVLGTDGGALPVMMLPYRLGVGGRVGSGMQWISWIHIEDMVRLIMYCIEHEMIQGPVNATGPNPATNDEFGRTLGKVLHRPHYFPVPALMLKLLMGELSDLILKGQRVLPQYLLDQDFQFKYATLEQAFTQLLQRK